jgi:hypothetical protein
MSSALSGGTPKFVFVGVVPFCTVWDPKVTPASFKKIEMR